MKKIKKIFLEVISNTKSFLYKILLNELKSDQDFVKITKLLNNVDYGTQV